MFHIHTQTDGLYKYIVAFTDVVFECGSVSIAGFDTYGDAESFIRMGKVQLYHRYTFMSH